MYRRIGTISRFYLHGVYGKLPIEQKTNKLSDFYLKNLTMTIFSSGACCQEKKYHFYSEAITKLETKHSFTILYFPHQCTPSKSCPLDPNIPCSILTAPNFLPHKWISAHSNKVTEYTYIDHIQFSQQAKTNWEIFQKSKEIFGTQFGTLKQLRYSYISSLETYFVLWYFQEKNKLRD